VEDANKLINKLDALKEKLHNPRAEVVYDILAKGGAKLIPACLRLATAMARLRKA
jgi:hypothetical protein